MKRMKSTQVVYGTFHGTFSLFLNYAIFKLLI